MKQRKILLDTGPLVAFLNKGDRYHEWTVAQFAVVNPPLLTCEAVLSETFFLLRHYVNAMRNILTLIENQLLSLPFRLEDEVGAIKKLLIIYEDIPMSLADACLVRMAEQTSDASLLRLTAISGYIGKTRGRLSRQSCLRIYKMLTNYELKSRRL